MTAALKRIKSISSLFLCLFIFFRIFKLCAGLEIESHVLCIIMCTQLWFFSDVLCWCNSKKLSVHVDQPWRQQIMSDIVCQHWDSFEWTYCSDKEHDVSAARMLWQKIHDNRTESVSNAWRDATTLDHKTQRAQRNADDDLWPQGPSFIRLLYVCSLQHTLPPTLSVRFIKEKRLIMLW